MYNIAVGIHSRNLHKHMYLMLSLYKFLAHLYNYEIISNCILGMYLEIEMFAFLRPNSDVLGLE